MAKGGLDISNQRIIKPARMQMTRNTNTLAKFTALAMLAVGSSMVQAASATPNCKISGEDGVIAKNKNNNRSLYALNYYYAPGTAAGNLELYQNGVPTGRRSEVVVDSSSSVVQLPGFGLTFSQLNGNSGFNHGVFTNKSGTACGTLVDTGNDGLADEIQVQLGAYGGRGAVPSMLISFPVTELTEGDWLLQVPPEWTNSTYLGPLNFLTPVNLAPVNQVDPPSISLVCNPSGTGGTGTQQTDANGTLQVVVNRETNARAPGPCVTTSIPTATFWGYAAMTLLLMFAGVRLLRKRGFGDDFNLRA